jgi:hypothetical protein
MIKYLLSDSCTFDYLNQIIAFYDFKIKASDYQKFLRVQTRNLKNHVRNCEIKKFCLGLNSPKMEYKTITRAMAKIYLKKIHLLNSFNSRKMQRSTRPLHLKYASLLSNYLWK